MTHIVTISGNIIASQNKVVGNVVTETPAVKGDVTVPITAYFDGAYEITPTTEAQTISIKGKTALEDIVVNPIPSNYGLITWNGAVLTVS